MHYLPYFIILYHIIYIIYIEEHEENRCSTGLVQRPLTSAEVADAVKEESRMFSAVQCRQSRCGGRGEEP